MVVLNKKTNGFTLVDVLIAIFVFTVLFAGIFALFLLAFRTLSLAKNKIIAKDIALGELEKIRGMDYSSIGNLNFFPYGSLPATSSKELNGIDFLIERRVDMIIDPLDGEAWPDDQCPFDYKKVIITVSWGGITPGRVSLEGLFTPKDSIEECQTSGGILSVLVFDSQGQPVSLPTIEIKNATTGEPIKVASPDNGKYLFALEPGNYRVDVSKWGYSKDRTYSIDEIAHPFLPNPNVIKGKVTSVSFSIDKRSAFDIYTYSDLGENYFFDSFLNENKISFKDNVLIIDGNAILSNAPGDGYLFSNSVVASNIKKWNNFSFLDEQYPGAEIRYHLYFFDASTSDWLLIPDTDLPGNSLGFQESPVDLSNLPTSYNKIMLKADFSSLSTTTPVLKNWQISWYTQEETPLGNVSFFLRGDKIIGTNAEGNPVYKFSTTTFSDSSGRVLIPDLEWDNYTFTSANSLLNIFKTEPEPQPISLAPDTTLTVKLFFRSDNSLFFTLKDNETLEPLLGAKVRLINQSLGYEKILYTNEKGQVLFLPLNSAIYQYEISNPGYATSTGSVFVSGNRFLSLQLTRLE